MGSAVFANTEIAKTSQLFPSQFKLIADVRFGSKADTLCQKRKWATWRDLQMERPKPMPRALMQAPLILTVASVPAASSGGEDLRAGAQAP